jgi:PPOX class probable F420-dependent enzyme
MCVFSQEEGSLLDEAAVRQRFRQARVARLATVDEKGSPHVVPICFAYDGRAFYTAVDRKPKRVPPEELARVRNIQARPQVALVVDKYTDDWKQLWYILVHGRASLLAAGEKEEQEQARTMLRDKYRQYADGMLSEEALLIRILPERIVSWGQA